MANMITLDLDTLDLSGLYALHSLLHTRHKDCHNEWMALPSKMGPEAGDLANVLTRISLTMGQVFEECRRREAAKVAPVAARAAAREAARAAARAAASDV
jgi:hypothetical protein